MKQRSFFIFLLALSTNATILAQDPTAWKLNTIDSFVSVTLPGELAELKDSTKPYVGTLEFPDVVIAISKHRPLQSSNPNIELAYDSLVNAYANVGFTLTSRQTIKNGSYLVRYTSGKLTTQGITYFNETQFFIINNTPYILAMVYKNEAGSKAIRDRFLNMVHITPGASQLK